MIFSSEISLLNIVKSEVIWYIIHVPPTKKGGTGYVHNHCKTACPDTYLPNLKTLLSITKQKPEAGTSGFLFTMYITFICRYPPTMFILYYPEFILSIFYL